jgi:hypothetical protein
MAGIFERAIKGGVAGLICGVLLFGIFCRTEPPVPARPIVISMILGSLAGGIVAIVFGERRISIFWLHFVSIFGCITVTPWWYSHKSHHYLPLGAAYVNSPNRGVLVFVFLPHVAMSIIAAMITSRIYRRVVSANPPGPPSGNPPDRISTDSN